MGNEVEVKFSLWKNAHKEFSNKVESINLEGNRPYVAVLSYCAWTHSFYIHKDK